MAKLVRCPKCRLTKDSKEFYINRSRSTGRTSYCKKCHIEKVTSMYSIEEIKIKNRKANLKKKYGLTLEDYARMADEQDHSCYICNERTSLVVDHCHKTGRVRKLLCVNCNSGLGMFRDNPSYLLKAKEYVLSQS